MSINIEHKKHIFIALPAIIMLLVLGTLFFWLSNHLTFENSLSSIAIKNNQYFNSHEVIMEMNYPSRFRPFNFSLDKRDITKSIIYSGGKASIRFEGLEEGLHNLKIYSGVNLYSMAPYDLSIYFTIDTVKPSIQIISPETSLLNSSKFTIKGYSDPFSKITFFVNGMTFTTKSLETGMFKKEILFNQGMNCLTVNVVDPAGNENSQNFTFTVDNSPPEVIPQAPVNKEVCYDNFVNVRTLITDKGSGLADVYFLVDNKKIVPVLRDGLFSAFLENLDDGEYKVVAVAEDKSGGITKKSWSFVIDASEIFGEKTLRPGARGQDVVQLQKSLIGAGFLKKGYLSGVYDKTTVRAVEKYEHYMKIEVSPVIDRNHAGIFCNRIKVYLNEFTLFLFSPSGNLIKTYPIACGSYSWPTPTGKYYIKDKQPYPTWYPPPSPWARGLKPIGPGPGNPLGTRWMGLSEHGIGIHGTPSEWSIGYPDSHGCIRMYISDAEDLYEYAQVGSSVEIYGSRSDDSQGYLVKSDGITLWNQMLGNGFISADILRDRMAQDSIWRDMLIYGFIPDDVMAARLAGNSLWDKMLIYGFVDEATCRKIYKNIIKFHTFGMADF